MLHARPFLILILAALFVAVESVWPRLSHSVNLLRRVTSTSEEAISLNPSISGDGSLIAFESTEDLASRGGETSFHSLQTDLTNNPVRFLQMANGRSVTPGISQDGTRITFASTGDPLGQNADGNSEVFRYDGSLKQITNTTAASLNQRVQDGNFQPSISDDGRFIAFASNRNLTGQNADANLEIFTFDNNTEAFTQTTNSTNEVGAADAKISGDGSFIAYVRDQGTAQNPQRDLVLQDRLAGTAQVIAANVDTVALTYGRAISDDGKRLVYSLQTASNTTQVFLFDSRWGLSRQLTSLGARTTDVPLNATISGDGRRIAFATRRNVVSNNSDGGVELFLYDIPTGQFSQLTSTLSSATAEVVSSLNDDGSIVAFNFPRVLSGAVANSDFASNSEIYTIAIEPRASAATATILNGASLRNDPSSPIAIAPDSIAVAQGGTLAFTEEQAQPLDDGTFPLAVGGTTVTINGHPAQILYVSPKQVNFLTPRETAIGPAAVVITNSEGFQSIGSVTVLPTAPGIFTFSGEGVGDGVILNADNLVKAPLDPTDGTLRLLIFATGVRSGSHVTASLGGQSVPVESVLPSPALPGLDEIHVLVPSWLRGSGRLDVEVQSDDLSSNSATTTLSGTSLRDITINEVLADPPAGTNGDANHDGVRNPSQDEFVELVNTTTRDIDISNFEILTRATSGISTLRHRFAGGTILSAGTSMIVFGGGNPLASDPLFGGAQVVKASTGGLSLSNTGGVVTLRDGSAAVLATISYGGLSGIPGNQGQSLTRSPDSSGDFVLHQSAPGSAGRLFSAGTKLDGTAFTVYPAVAEVRISPTSATIATAGQQQFTALARDQNGQVMADVIFSWRSSAASIATIDQTGLGKGSGVGVAQVFAAARGVESGPATLTVAVPATSPSPLPSPSPGPSASPSPSASPTPLLSVVISEFRTRGTGGASDEFVELYNSSDRAIDISGWKIRGSSSTGLTITNKVTINANTTIPARCHFLATNSAAHGYSGAIVGDQTYTSGIADDGGLALTLPDNTVVDQVGMSVGSAFSEGTNVAPQPGDANQSYERKPGGASGSTQDTGNNFDDFVLITPSDPQNLSSPPTPGASPGPSPTPSISPSPMPSPFPSPSPSPAATPSPTMPVVISEFRTRGPGGANDEFLELYNNSDGTVDVSGWKIRGSNNAGSVTTRLTISHGTTIPAHGHFLATNGSASGYSGSITGDQTYTSGIVNDGGLAITLPDDSIVDQVGLSSGSAFREGMNLAPLPSDANQSYERKPGGASGSTQDTGNNFNDFQLLTPSDPQNSNSVPTPDASPSPSPTPGASPSPGPSPTPTISPSPNPSPSPSPSPGSSPFPSPSPSPSPSSSPSPAASPTPGPPVVISEFRTRGPSGANDEFIELYNKGESAIDVSGWKLRGSNNAASITTRVTINNGTTIAAHGHFLATNSSAAGYSGAIVGDQTYTSGITNDGGIALTFPDDSIVDQVGLSSGSAFKEGTNLAPLPSDANQSYERKPGGTSGSSQDTGDNFNDFQLTTSEPQNLSSNPTPGATASPSPTPGLSPSPYPSPSSSPSPSPDLSPSPSPAPTPITKVVISQLYGGGGNAGAPFKNDFIEIFNAGNTPVDLSGWSVQYAGATGTNWSVTNLTSTLLLPGHYYLIQEASGGAVGASLPTPDAGGTTAMAAGAGKVALVNNNTALSGSGCHFGESMVDFIGYGATADCFEGTGRAPAPSNLTADIRGAGGCTDTDNNSANFAAAPPTPRNTASSPNQCSGTTTLPAAGPRRGIAWPELLAWLLIVLLRP